MNVMKRKGTATSNANVEAMLLVMEETGMLPISDDNKA